MKRSLVLPVTFLFSAIAASAQVTVDLPIERPADVKVAASAVNILRNRIAGEYFFTSEFAEVIEVR
jgi:hypothetical protein